MKNKLKNAILFSATLAIFNSCNMVNDYTINSEEGIKNLQELVVENTPKDAKITGVTFMNLSETSNDINNVLVDYFQESVKDSIQEILISTTGIGKPQKAEGKLAKDYFQFNKSKEAAVNSIEISKLDVTELQEYVSKAVAKINNPDLEIFNVYNASMRYNGDTKKMEYDFILNMQKKGADGDFNGNKTTYTVFPYNCKVANGILSVEEDK